MTAGTAGRGFGLSSSGEASSIVRNDASGDGSRRHLFVELLGGFGDLIIALPAIQALARSHPDVPLDVLTVRPGGELLVADPLIDAVFTAPPTAAAAAVQQLLSRRRYELVVTDTRHSRIPEMIEAHVAASGGRSVTDLWRGAPQDERVGQRFLRLLAEEGVADPDGFRPPVVHLPPSLDRREPGRRSDDRKVVLLPHAGVRLKRWAPARFADVVRLLRDRDPAVRFAMPLGPRQRPPRALTSAHVEVVPTPDLLELAAFLTTADLAVGGDTGPLHLAAALGVPTVAVFGPTWGERYAPSPGHAVLQGMPCCEVRNPSDFTTQRCWVDGDCPIRKWGSCTEAIGPGWVVEAAAKLLEVPQAATPAAVGLS